MRSLNHTTAVPSVYARTIPAALARAAGDWPDVESVIDGDVRLTFRDLDDRSLVAAQALIAAGIRPDDRVGIWAPNWHEWIVALFGIYRAGATLIPLNTRYKADEAKFILERARARLLFTTTAFLGVDYVGELVAAGGAEGVEQVIALRGPARAGVKSWAEFLDGARGVGPDEVFAREDALTYDDTSDILFTSGTTGTPKGAMLRHGASARAFEDYGEVNDMRAGDRMLGIPPFFHGFGLKAGILVSVLRGMTLIPMETFDTQRACRLIATERVTVLPGPPTVFQMLCADSVDPEQFASLRVATTGSARMEPSILMRAKEVMGLSAIITGYGLTEATTFSSHNTYRDSLQANLETVGTAVPGTELKVVAEDGTDLGIGEAGEVLIRGYTVMKGYFEDPEATAWAIDPDGWLRTGDVGTLDHHGRLRITDRKKDMFIVGGFNAYPAEIEKLLITHPSVADAAVLGIPDERLGEVGIAFVVPAAGQRPQESELIAWSRERLANFKVPRRVVLLPELPRNASGKVVKSRLRDRVVI
jgi:acyl-CoA synthetase (AMP-forming)/AMP-acid ligase II